MPEPIDYPLYVGGFNCWPAYIKRDGGFFPVVRFLHLADHLRAPTAPMDIDIPGNAFSTAEEALSAARSALPDYARPGLFALLWGTEH